jgi:hypothetical protein
METGTEILLARMKDHPEEFVNDNRALHDELRWDRVLRDAREHLPKEDIDALDAGIKQLYVDRFNERVLKVLAGESEQEETVKYKASGRYAAGATDPRVLFGGATVKAEGSQVDAHREYMNEMARQQNLMNQMEMDQARRQMNSAQNTLGRGISSFGNIFKFGRAD